jgi:DNA-binding MarR family transcriptional regulator
MNANDLLLFAEVAKSDWDSRPEHYVGPGYAAASGRLVARGLLRTSPTNERYVRLTDEGERVAAKMLSLLENGDAEPRVSEIACAYEDERNAPVPYREEAEALLRAIEDKPHRAIQYVSELLEARG